MFAQIGKYCRDRRGAVAVEYALLAIFLAVTVVSVVSGIGAKLGTYFAEVSSALK